MNLHSSIALNKIYEFILIFVLLQTTQEDIIHILKFKEFAFPTIFIKKSFLFVRRPRATTATSWQILISYQENIRNKVMNSLFFCNWSLLLNYWLSFLRRFLCLSLRFNLLLLFWNFVNQLIYWDLLLGHFLSFGNLLLNLRLLRNSLLVNNIVSY